MLYRPFADHFDEVTPPPEDLTRLTDVHEGWYVDYKQELIGNRELAKSLSSFANQYGGWLFLGIQEDRTTHVAGSFPGIPNEQVQRSLDSLRNAAKDLLRPSPFYNVRVFQGPIDAIGLKEGSAVIVVHVPEGPDSPYVHNDGRIYMRVGDSSQPKYVTDRATFDLLARRGQEARSKLEDRVMWSPVTSQGEENQPFIHLSILSDPYEVMGHWYGGGFEGFAEAMRGIGLPFDNIFSSHNGFVARQIGRNGANRRVLTWHFSRHCHSFVTIPIPTMSLDLENPIWNEYSIGNRFVEGLVDTDLTYGRVLDLNVTIDLIGHVMRRHRILADKADIRGPFFLKACIENVWRTIPFIDHSKYLEHIKDFGYPLVQETDMVVPDGTSLDTFVVSPEIESPPQEGDFVSAEGPIEIAMRIFDALGIPMVVLARSIEELHSAGGRSQNIQRKIMGG